MRLVVVGLLLVVSVAGCSDDAAQEVAQEGEGLDVVASAEAGGRQSASAPGADEAMPSSGHFEQTYELLAQDLAAGGQHLTASQESDNCLLFDDAAVLLSGSATVTWESSPATMMDLILWVDDEHKAFVTGGSPLVLDLAGFEVGVDGPAMLSWQVAQDAPAGAALLTEGTLVLSVDYQLIGEDIKMNPDSGWTCVAER